MWFSIYPSPVFVQPLAQGAWPVVELRFLCLWMCCTFPGNSQLCSLAIHPCPGANLGAPLSCFVGLPAHCCEEGSPQ